MEITAWVGVAIVVLASGNVSIMNTGESYKTEKDCLKVNAEAVKGVEHNKDIVGLGTSCVKVVVKSHGAAS